MQIVIEIPEDTYTYWINEPHERILADAIKNGKPLPKGHGDLIDRDEVKELDEMLCATECDCCTLDGCFYDRAKTIIEADRSEEE